MVYEVGSKIMTDWTKERDRLAKEFGENKTEGSSVGEEYFRDSFKEGWDARDVEIKARIAGLERERDDWKRRAGVFEAARDKWMLAEDESYMEAREYRDALVAAHGAYQNDHAAYAGACGICRVLSRHPAHRRKLAEAKEAVIKAAKEIEGKPNDSTFWIAVQGLFNAIFALREAEKEAGKL